MDALMMLGDRNVDKHVTFEKVLGDTGILQCNPPGMSTFTRSPLSYFRLLIMFSSSPLLADLSQYPR